MRIKTVLAMAASTTLVTTLLPIGSVYAAPIDGQIAGGGGREVKAIIKLKDNPTPPVRSEAPAEKIGHVNKLRQKTQHSQRRLVEQLKNGKAKNIKPYFVVNAVAVTAKKSLLTQVAKLEEVEKITVNAKRKLDPVKDEKARQDRSTSTHIPWNIRAAGVSKELQDKYGGKGVVVGVIDSGVDLSHPEISASWRGNTGDKAASWYDALGASNKPVDKRGHGTHVTGTILGSHTGVAPGAKWIGARVFDDNGETSDDRLLDAAQWMLAPKDSKGVAHPELAPRIINSSWGGSSQSEFFRPVLKQWRSAGILPVFSAGNRSASNNGGEGSIGTPASFPEAFAVGAIRKDDKVAKFSLRGPSKFTDKAKPDIVAPGVNIRSSAPGGKYVLHTGTSMAAPHVSGVAALVLSANPKLNTDQLEQTLLSSATPLVDETYVTSPNHGYGAGKVNAALAVQTALDGKNVAKVSGKVYVPGSDKSAPTITHTPLKNFYRGAAATFSGQISDDTGLSQAWVEVRRGGQDKWERRSLKLVQGNKKNGRYETEITEADLKSDLLTYRLGAKDRTGKEAVTKDYEVSIKSGVGIGYKEDFEAGADGFEYGGKTPMWKWGKPPKAVGAHSGEKAMGVGLKGEGYSGLDQATLLTPPIDLDSKGASLSFWHYYDLDNAQSALFDTGEVWVGEIRDDSGEITWEKQPQRIYRNHQRSWKQEYLDLSPYKGKRIRVMFGVRGQAMSKKATPGWFIDDVKIEKATTAKPAAPSEDINLDSYPEGRTIYEFKPLSEPTITGYALYRSHDGGPWQKVQTISRQQAGKYSTRIADWPRPQKGTYSYYAVALAGDVESSPSKVLSRTFSQGKEIYSFNFEDSDQGWTSEPDAQGNRFERGIPSITDAENHGQGPSPQTSKGKNEGANVFGTVLNDFRHPKATYRLTSPKIDLSGREGVQMYFQSWFNTQGRKGNDEYGSYDNDQGKIEVSNDGSTWHTIFELNEATISKDKERRVGAWHLDHVDIPKEYLGATTQVRFTLQSGTDQRDSQSGGWYLDDVTFNVPGETTPPPPVKSEVVAHEAADIQLMQSEGTKAVSEGPTTAESWVPATRAHVRVEGEGSSYPVEEGSGDYRLATRSGNVTLVASAPGYAPKRITTQAQADKETKADFYLEKVAVNSLKIDITNAEAKVSIYQDGEVTPVFAGQGKSLTVKDLPAGDYTLRVEAKGMATVEKPLKVTKETKPLTLTMKKVKEGPEGELALDNGQAASALDSLNAGSTVAVKFSAKEESKVKKVRLRLAGVSDDVAETEFEWAIWGQNDADGLPQKILSGPHTMKAKPTAANPWVEIELATPVQVKGDFFVSYTQKKQPAKGVALLAKDSGKTKSEHSYKLINGAFHEADEEGEYMIRAMLAPIAEVKANPSLADAPAIRGVAGMAIAPVKVAIVNPGGVGKLSCAIGGVKGLTAAAAEDNAACVITGTPAAPYEGTYRLTLRWGENQKTSVEGKAVITAAMPNPGTSPGKVDGSTQTEVPGKADGSTQTEVPGKADGSTQTEVPGKADGSTQTEVPGKADGSTQTEVPGKAGAGAKSDKPATGTGGGEEPSRVAKSHNRDISKPLATTGVSLCATGLFAALMLAAGYVLLIKRRTK